MEAYTIIATMGFVVLLLGFAAWAFFRGRANAAAGERMATEVDARTREAAHERRKAEWANGEPDRQAADEVEIRDRIRQGANKPTEQYLPTPSNHVDPADAKTSRLRKSTGLALMGCALLALSTGCTRTVYVDAKPPPLKVKPTPAMDEPKEEWQVWALTVERAIQRYNEEWAQ